MEFKAIKRITCYIPQVTIYIVQVFSLSVFAELQTSTISKETCLGIVAVLEIVVMLFAIIACLEGQVDNAIEVESFIVVLVFYNTFGFSY